MLDVLLSHIHVKIEVCSKQGINFPTKTLVQGRTYCSPLRGEELADLTTKVLTRLGTKRDIDITRNNQMYLLDHTRLEVNLGNG